MEGLIVTTIALGFLFTLIKLDRIIDLLKNKK